ncbi:uncharacterized protein B0H18DRAFT_992374 [Fomitopsis serialis]|uniref:uncharacterized protein n=1 Tax=Fomitopsis serialis TaxID=139415 RepID=UPI0020079A07|nr:uncharacterized protein B0H18DRAFT_992374 [Neoantrodia serialis]KAH9930590.1 hypothetical protein B0H18DRAFT_992374 [Neoantrodia serialis]
MLPLCCLNMRASSSTSQSSCSHWAKIAKSIKTTSKSSSTQKTILSPIDTAQMGLYMTAHRLKNDRTVALYRDMEDHYTSAIAACDSWLTAHANQSGSTVKFRPHSSAWKRQRSLDGALARLRDAGITYDPSSGEPRLGSLSAGAMSDAHDARLHWLELQPERRTVMYFDKYEVSGRKKTLTDQLLALKKAEGLHRREMRRLFAERVQAAQHRGLRNLRCVVWFNRIPYAVLHDKEQNGSRKRRRAWRRVGKTVMWLQRGRGQVDQGSPPHSAIDA